MTKSAERTQLCIAFIGEYDPEDAGVAGANVHAMLIRALRERGHTVKGFDCELRGMPRIAVAARLFSGNRERWRGRFHLHPTAFAARTAIARRLLAGAGPLDAVIQHGTAFDARLAGVPHLIWTDTSSSVTRREPYSWMGAMLEPEQRLVDQQERELLQGSDIIMPFSRYAGDSMIALAGAPAQRIRPTYAGPSMAMRDGREGRRDRKTSGGPVKVLFIGREFARKGGDAFVEAVRRVRERGTDLRAVIAGPTTLPDCPDFVEFLGFLDKRNPADVTRLHDAYAKADMFCLPTRREPFGIVVAEAMLCGLPVVATRISAIPEMVRDGETGFLVEVDDVASIAAKLEQLARDPDLRYTLGSRGLEYASSRFTWDAVASRVEAAVHEAIAERRR